MTIHDYGLGAFRSAAARNRYLCADDGRTLLSAATYGLTYREPTLLEAVDLRTGAVTAGPLITAMATGGQLVAVAAGEAPTAITVLSVPGLRLIRRVEAGAPITRVAVGGSTIAAVAEEPPMLTVRTDAGEHRVDLPDAPSCLVVSEDGGTVLVGTDRGRSGHVVVVDASTGSIRHVLTGPRAPVTSLAISTAGDLVVAGAGPRAFGWWVTETKPHAVTLWSADDTVAVIGVEPSGRVIAGTAREAVVAIDPASAGVVWSAEQQGPSLLHGGLLLSTSFDQVRELDLVTGEVLRQWECVQFVKGLAGGGGTLVASDDSSRPRLLAGDERPARLGSGHAGRIKALSFDGDRFATLGRDRQVCVWARGRTEPLHSITTPGRPSPDDAGLLLTGSDVYAGVGTQLYRWRLGTPEPLARTERLSSTVVLVHGLDDGTLLVGCAHSRRSYGRLYVVDAETLEIQRENRSTYVSPHARRDPGATTIDLCYSLGSRTFDLATLEMVGEERVPSEDYSRASFLTPSRELLVEVRVIAPDPDRSLLFITDVATKEHLVRDRAIPKVVGHPTLIHDRLVTPHPDAIRLWDARTGEARHELPMPQAPAFDTALHVVPDGDALLIAFGSGALYELPLP